MNNIKRDVRWWMNTATIAAFSALIVTLCEYWIGSDTWFHYIAVTITSTFFIVAVIWWYWAIMKIAQFSKYILGLKETISTLKEDLQSIRKDIK